MTENEKFAEVVRVKTARAEMLKRILIVVTTALVTVSLVMSYQTQQNTDDAVDAIRKTQETGSPVLKAIADQQDDIEAAANAATSLNALVLDCFDPTSQCAKQAAADEAEQAGAYNAAVIAAQFCVGQVLGEVYTLRELTRCVGDIINEPKG